MIVPGAGWTSLLIRHARVGVAFRDHLSGHPSRRWTDGPRLSLRSAGVTEKITARRTRMRRRDVMRIAAAALGFPAIVRPARAHAASLRLTNQYHLPSPPS